MSIDQCIEPLKTCPVRRYDLAEAARLFFDSPPHPASMTRWILQGILLRSGDRLKLKAERHPNRWVVTEASVRDFIAALTADRLGEPAPPPAEATAARRRVLERVDAELSRIGI
jgi:hypothetical protein